MNRRLLVLALVLTLAASAWALWTDDASDTELAVEQHAVRHAQNQPPRVAMAGAGAARADAVALRADDPSDGVSLGLPTRPAPSAARRDLFAGAVFGEPAVAPVAAAPASAVAVAPAPAAVPASAPPPPPRPSLPFSFGGRLTTAAGTAVLLNEGATTHLLALGGSLAGFRLDGDQGASLVFTHEASGEQLTLATTVP